MRSHSGPRRIPVFGPQEEKGEPRARVGAGECGSDFARSPPVGSGYQVAAARGSAGSNAAGLAGGAWAAEELRGARPAGSPAAHLERSGRTWAGRGAGAQARDRASPLPTSPAGAHLGDSQRKRSLAATSPGNAGGPAGRQEAAAAEELNRTAHGSHSHPSRRRRHLHLAPVPRAAPPAGHRFPPPAQPTCQVRRLSVRGDPAIRARDRVPDGPEAARCRLDAVSRAGFSCPPRERAAGTRLTPVAVPLGSPGARLQHERSTLAKSPSGPREGGSPAEALLKARQLGLAGCLPAPGCLVGPNPRRGGPWLCRATFPANPPDSPRLETAAAGAISKLSDWFGRRLVVGRGHPRSALFRVHSPSQDCAHFPVEGGRVQVFVAGGNRAAVPQPHTLLLEDLLT